MSALELPFSVTRSGELPRVCIAMGLHKTNLFLVFFCKTNFGNFFVKISVPIIFESQKLYQLEGGVTGWLNGFLFHGTPVARYAANKDGYQQF